MSILKVKNMRRALQRFSGENGSVTIEAVLWLPFFVVFLTLIADVALIFHGQARALRIVQDANRNYSTGFYENATETQDAIVARLSAERLTPNAKAQTVVSDGIITSTVEIPSGDLDAIGFFTSLASIDMQIRSQHVMEN